MSEISVRLPGLRRPEQEVGHLFDAGRGAVSLRRMRAIQDAGTSEFDSLE
ncbi:MAG: hypothetical protein ACYCVB_08805 [Bacilli bacterium]